MAQQSTDKASEKQNMDDSNKNILIVDDDISLGEVLLQALKYTDRTYDVRLARDADEALALISRHHFDLVITDIKMAGLSGLQLLEALRQVAPDVQTIVMTAFDSTDIEDRARSLGVYAYIAKPFAVQEFRALVNDALKSEAHSTPPKLALQSQSVNETLAELRANTGAHAAFFIEEETANILGVASDTNDLDLGALAKALLDIPNRMTAEVARVFGGGSGFRRSQYIGEAFNLSTYRLTGKGLLIVVYGHHVKEGIISFYARQTLKALASAWQTESSSPPAPSSLPESPPEITQASTGEPMSFEQALAEGLLDNDFLQTIEEEE